MIFKSAPLPPDEEFCVQCWNSESGLWILTIDRVMYGCRVHLRRNTSLCYEIDYCAGSLPVWQLALATVIQEILKPYPEDIPVQELRKIWPEWRIRPMFNDVACWHKLCQMANMPQEFEKEMLTQRYGGTLEDATRFL